MNLSIRSRIICNCSTNFHGRNSAGIVLRRLYKIDASGSGRAVDPGTHQPLNNFL